MKAAIWKKLNRIEIELYKELVDKKKNHYQLYVTSEITVCFSYSLEVNRVIFHYLTYLFKRYILWNH